MKWLILIYVCFSWPLFSQETRFQETTAFHKKPLLYIGTIQANFLNSRFTSNVNAKILNRQPGFALGMNITPYPFLFHAGYFTSSYKVENHTWEYEKGTMVKHRGFEIGAAVMLLPQVKYVQPFIGASYQNGSIGVGLDQYDSTSDNIPVSSVKASTALIRTGVLVRFIEGLGLSGDYQRALQLDDNPKAFNRFSISLLVNPY